MVESNLSELPTEEIRSTLCETVEQYLNSKHYEISVGSASQAGENNFIGVVYRVSFHKTDDEPSAKSSMLILKVAPQNEARRNQFMSRPLFLREIYMYDKVTKVENCMPAISMQLIITYQILCLGFTLFPSIRTNQRDNYM